MTKPILVTGGTGRLGPRTVRRLQEAGRDVRVLTRRRQEAPAGVDYVVGDLSTGEGVEAAVAGVGVIVHCATSTKGDVEATRHLVRAAIRAGRPHMVYVSIVGLDHIASRGYPKAKLECERMVAESGLPWTILRATQFYDYILTNLRRLAKPPVALVPARFHVQPVDQDEVAARLAKLALGEPAGRVPQIAGPLVTSWAELLRDYLHASHKRRWVVALWIPGTYSRTPTLLAMSARSIYDLSNGRFGPFGLGAGGIGFMQRGHGIVTEKPLARAKETVAIVRSLLTQKKFSYEGQWFRPHEFHLREGPIGQDAPPIWLAGLGPKMVGTAAEVADGVIANWLTDESLAEYRGLIRQGAESAGRDPSDVQIATLLMTCVDPDDEAAMFAARRGIAFYCASEHYLHIADICGLGADARKVKVAWEERDFDRATELVSDRLLEKFCLVGTPVENARRIEWLFDNSVYPIVYPLPRRDRMVEDHRSVLEQVAQWSRALDWTAVDP